MIKLRLAFGVGIVRRKGEERHAGKSSNASNFTCPTRPSLIIVCNNLFPRFPFCSSFSLSLSSCGLDRDAFQAVSLVALVNI